MAAASYDPNQATPAENVFQATRRFKRFETFWNVFQAQANFLPGRRPSIHSYRATRRTKSKMAVFCQKTRRIFDALFGNIGIVTILFLEELRWAYWGVVLWL